eukprot:4395518-Pleurochrysis_carterae.AAC.1
MLVSRARRERNGTYDCRGVGANKENASAVRFDVAPPSARTGHRHAQPHTDARAFLASTDLSTDSRPQPRRDQGGSDKRLDRRPRGRPSG